MLSNCIDEVATHSGSVYLNPQEDAMINSLWIDQNGRLFDNKGNALAYVVDEMPDGTRIERDEDFLQSKSHKTAKTYYYVVANASTKMSELICGNHHE